MRVYYKGHKAGKRGQMQTVEHTVEVDTDDVVEARNTVMQEFAEQGVKCIRCFAVAK